MSDFKIKIDLHECGHGFQIVFDGPGMHKVYPQCIDSLKNALAMSDFLKENVERVTGKTIPDDHFLIAMDAVEANAGSSDDCLKLYRLAQTSKINLHKEG